MEWQLIETAPKGIGVLVYCKNGDVVSAIRYEYRDDWQLTHTGSWAEDGDLYSRPIFWMFYPDPPIK